ncbi:class I SAM-dependent methyltransferase [Yinghuangia seranimata]|uniref:class I SAM-dependent methyltransferase n=1 Tax=Yinghuangia seranimata TaxID=408067 RepID=UPI00248BC861|nr:class I SAM-dependent methyltransferase [Yinghuangia seranimata]MDI2129533.1 class I SAM-dependent methyltransferase [Yinghuangia seranimata]
MIARARESAADHPQLTFVEGDFLDAELPGVEHDFICSVTTIHHMDFEAALVRMRELLRPGGTLVVVGVAREASVREWAASIAAAPIVRITKVLRRARAPQGMPVADPQMSYGQVRAAARRLLPGVRYRRHVSATVRAERPCTRGSIMWTLGRTRWIGASSVQSRWPPGADRRPASGPTHRGRRHAHIARSDLSGCSGDGSGSAA